MGPAGEQRRVKVTTTMAIYYNEFDRGKAAWLRELMKRGAISEGDVDERSICDVRPDDLRGYRRCHFFAGIGLWDAALNASGWPADREAWTGSCPCQGFSAAGKRKGFKDERHLWPDWFKLIQSARPAIVLGEQVSSIDGLQWWDLVKSDLNAAGYAAFASDLPACGFGAPQRRQRLYFLGERDAST